MPTALQESRALTAEAVTGQPGRFRIELITPGWGSSGYYSPQVLEAAGRAGVFGAGTKQYIDHPSYSEAQDRPERSVRDIAGVLLEAAHWDDAAQALVADAQVFGPYREILAEMKDAIGVSIRAAATVEHGEADGRTGQIITELVEGISVDFVTDAGRGGRIAQVIESARARMELTREAALSRVAEARNVGTWIESRLHLSLTQIADEMFGDGRLTREERIALSGAVGDGLTAFTAALEQSAPQLYARDLWAEPEQVVAAATESVPVLPAGQSTTQESEEDTMPEIAEAELTRLREDAGRVQTLESERDAAARRAEEAEHRLREADARNTARPIATEVVGASESLPPSTRTRVVEAAVAGVQLREDGTFDEAAFRTAVEAARTQAETELAEAMQAAGAGRVRGVGHTTSTGSEQAVTEADLDALDDAVFGEIKEA